MLMRKIHDLGSQALLDWKMIRESRRRMPAAAHHWQAPKAARAILRCLDLGIPESRIRAHLIEHDITATEKEVDTAIRLTREVYRRDQS